MKIFAITGNYPAEGHRDFLTFGADTETDWYEMPDSSILRSGNPFFIPDFSSQFRVFPSVVYRIGRLGKSIAPRFARRYIDGIGAAAAVVATDLLEDLRSSGKSWTRATAFDRSCLLGNLQPIDTFNESEPLKIECGETSFMYDCNSLKDPIDTLISKISADNTLKNGDLVLAGLTPDGILLRPDTHLSVKTSSSETNLLDIIIK